MKIILLFLLSILHLAAYGQKHAYEDLLVLYVDEKYEKCIDKADRYATNDNTRRDPLPFLYMSMCYHEMSKLEAYTSQHEYRFAERDALKYAVRFRKKDKELEYFHNYEDFWRELNGRAMESALHHYEMGGYSKARRILDRMVGYMPENPGAWMFRALAQKKMKLHRDAQESLKSFERAYKDVGDLSRLSPDQRSLMVLALVLYADHVKENEGTAAAREVMELGADEFMGEAEFKAVYKSLN